ncbi:MAG: hypothetical protein ACI8RZ_000765 [Myxococcota bacterium]|jgi:hypothetical protein
MPTLLLPPSPSPESIALRAAALARGWSVVRSGWRIPEDLDPTAVVIYGGELFSQLASQHLGLIVPVPQLSWLPDLPEDLRRRRILWLSRAEAGAHPDRAFFKPADDKWFAAGVYPSGAALPEAGEEDLERPVYVSDVVRFTVEYRVFLAHGVALTGSRYAIDGAPAAPALLPEAVRVLAERAAVGLPDGAVVDIGEIAGAGLAVVEANPAQESALYGADPDAVLTVLAALFSVA